MEIQRCSIEILEQKRKKETEISAIEQLTERRDIVLVAAGSLGCLRGIYLKLLRSGRLSQFIPCILTPAEYAQGINMKKMQSCLQKAVDRMGVQCVVIYASCLDYLTGSNYAEIFNCLVNPRQIRLEILWRGPLVKRRIRLGQKIKELLDSLPEEQEQAAVGEVPMPIPAVDFDGLNGMLEEWNRGRVLITSGGCIGALTIHSEGETEQKKSLAYSRMDDILISMGCEYALEKALEKYGEKEKITDFFLMKTAVPSFISADTSFISLKLKERNFSAVSLESNGSETPPVAIAQAYMKLGKAYFDEAYSFPAKENTVEILGYSFLSNGKKMLLMPGINRLNDIGYEVWFWDPQKKRKASVHWVVAAEAIPLAEYAKQRGIPYLAEIPVGEKQEEQWLRRLLGRNAENVRGRTKSEEEGLPWLNTACIFITGEPLLSAGIEKYFRKKNKQAIIRKGIYAPVPSMERLYRMYFPEPEWRYFRTAQELQILLEDTTLFVGDPVYKTWADIKSIPLFPVPYPMLSGNVHDKIFYAYFGRQWDKYLKSFGEICSKKEERTLD